MKITKSLKIIALLISFSSCFQLTMAIAKYRACPLMNLSNQTSQADISFNYRVFNKKDCKKFLGRDIIISKGYQPIQVEIINNSNTSLIFNPTSFSFPTIPCFEFADDIQFNTTKRVVAWGIPGLFIWPLLIPAVIEAFEAPKANDKLFNDYSQKILGSQEIEPSGSLNGIIIVDASQFNRNFTLQLTQKGSNNTFEFSAINHYPIKKTV